MIRSLFSILARRLLSAATLCAALVATSPVALAQTNAAGSISGNDVDPGAVVTVTNQGTGAARTDIADGSGRFQVSALQPGVYSAEVTSDGQLVATRTGILVTIGGVTAVSFSDTVVMDEVVVYGGRTDIDTSATDTRTVFTSDDFENLTVGLSIEDLTLLAPGTVRGDSRYNTDRGRSSVSFGGAGANENAFYINGYAVTDVQKGLGSSSLPFNAISQMQVLTGGYGAEFGRSTGGVVNIVTKSGTNEWEAGTLVTYAPDSLEATRKDSYYRNPETPQNGALWSENSRRAVQGTLYSAYVGGPIVKDKLFMYVAGEMEKRLDNGPRTIRNTSGTQATAGTDGWLDRDYEVPRWLAKLDWNIAEGHTMEFTGISDVQKQRREYYGYYYSDTNGEGLPSSTLGSTLNGGYEYEDGGETYIAKYTGALTENLIFTALYGTSKQIHKELPIGYDPSVAPVRDTRSTVPTNLNIGPFTTLKDIDAYDDTDGYRLDLEYLVGDHDIRVGYDVQNLLIKDGTTMAGPGYLWSYEDTLDDPIPGSGGASNPGGNGEYVTKSIYNDGGTFEAEQYAYFLEDRWQITDNMLLSLGLRNENFKNYSADGVLFLSQTDQWAPRLGVSYDLKGDREMRIFANAGRYTLAIPLNVALRQVGATTNTDEYFSFTSIDPTTGVPQGLTPLGDGPFSVNGEYGDANDPQKAAARDLKAYYQDEIAIGFEGKFRENFIGGARLIYRELGSQIDDNCDARPAYNWAVQNGYESGVADPYGTGLDEAALRIGLGMSCVIVNPGESNTIRLDLNSGTDLDPDYVYADISAAEWGLPKLKREYKGLDLFLEHPLRNGWYGKIDWTISKSEGNAEGQLLSDLGQSDVSVTLNWDHPELMVGSDGPLPNDRRHQIKAYVFFQLRDNISLSATFTAASGRPLSPSGAYNGEPQIAIEPTAVGTCDTQCFYDNWIDYGGVYYRYNYGETAPRGSGGRLPWTTILDLGVTYYPEAIQGLSLGLDVFNVTNTQQPQNRVEYFDNGGSPYSSYNKILSYNAPRSVRFNLAYKFGQ